MRRIILLAFDGAQGLDVFGPAEVFAGVGRISGAPAYQVILASVGGAGIRATSGILLETRDLARTRPRPGDTVLAVGGEEDGVRKAVRSASLVGWLARAARVVERVGSVCSGAFLLAAAGILDGRRAATHWSACHELARFRPRVTVDPNAIFVNEGRIWTSAGVTTGIDMALAMVEEDHGRRMADLVAARLVLHARRPGYQSQFSELLVAQANSSDALSAVVVWVRANLRRPIGVPALARKAAMSVRTLHRRCREELGTTPAKLIERVRVEQARTLLGTTSLGHKSVAAACGFTSGARLRRAFERTVGVGPSQYRLMASGSRGRAPGSRAPTLP